MVAVGREEASLGKQCNVPYYLYRLLEFIDGETEAQKKRKYPSSQGISDPQIILLLLLLLLSCASACFPIISIC